MNAVMKLSLRLRRRSILWWSVASVAFIFINMVFYPSFKDQAAELQKSFETIPDAAVQFLGGSTDFFSPVGFLNSQIFFIMLPLIGAILAIGLGSSLLAREEQQKTVELLLARPLTRWQLVWGKTLAGLVIVTAVFLVSMVSTVLMSKYWNVGVPIKNIVFASLYCWLLSLTFGALAFLVTAIGKARGASMAIASAIALGGYVIFSLSATVSWLRFPSKLLPFYHYQSEQILRGNMSLGHLLYLVAVPIGCVLLAGWLFNRRDISS